MIRGRDSLSQISIPFNQLSMTKVSRSYYVDIFKHAFIFIIMPTLFS